MHQFVLVASTWLIAAMPPGADDQTGALLKQVPEGTVLAVQIKGLDRTQARLVEMVDAMVPGMGQAVRPKLDEFKTMLLQGRALRGVAADGRIVAALTAFPAQSGPTPPGVLLLETTNYKALRDSLGGSPDEAGVELQEDPAGFEKVTRSGRALYFVRQGKFTAVATEARMAARLAGAQQEGVQVSPRLASTFENGDVGLYLDMVAVRKEYAENIRNTRDQFLGLLTMGARMQAGGATEVADAQVQAAKQLFESLFTLIEDTKAIAAGATFEKRGFGLSLLADVEPESQTGTFLANLKPSANQLFGQLPSGHHMYLGMSDPKVFESLQSFGITVLRQFGPGVETLQKQASEQLAAGPRGMAAAFRVDPKGARGVTVMRFDRPADALRATLNTTQAMTSAKFPGPFQIKDLKVEKDVAEHRGIRITKVATKLDYEALANQPNGQVAVAQMRAMFGDEMVQWMAANETSMFQIVEPSLEAVKARLDQLLDGRGTAGDEATFSEVRRHLPEESTVIVQLDLPAMLGWFLEQMAAAFGGPGSGISLPPGNPGFAGFAVVAEPRVVEFDLWVPSDAVLRLTQRFQAMGSQLRPTN